MIYVNLLFLGWTGCLLLHHILRGSRGEPLQTVFYVMDLSWSLGVYVNSRDCSRPSTLEADLQVSSHGNCMSNVTGTIELLECVP